MNSVQDTERLLVLAEEYSIRCNMRLTKPRKWVLIYLARVNKPVTAEELWYMLRFQKHPISMSGVYNALNWLEQAGIVCRLCQVQDKKAQFALTPQ